MALLGNPFKEYVVKQVKKRQEALGQGLGGYPVNDLISINNKSAFLSSTPYIHLASAVVIQKETDDALPGTSVYQSIKASGLLEGIPESDWVGSGLARKFMLTGAPNSITGKRSPSGVVGVDSGNTIPGASGNTTNNEYPEALIKAYGWGYNSTGVNSGQGYVPPPGVTSVDFEYKNDGALALASINIKAFSKEQFAMIDILYMRPGYTCLLEFGHSVYLDNNGKIVNVDVFQSDPLNYLFNDFETYALPKSAISMSTRIARAKELKEGNYEGFFARITKFNWKFNMDGSYDITIKLTGLGDVISSLNTLQPMGNDGKPFSINSDFVMKAEAKDSDVGAETRRERQIEENARFNEASKAKDEDTPWYSRESIRNTLDLLFGNAAVEVTQDVVFGIADAAVDVAQATSDFFSGDVLDDSDKKSAEEEGAFVITDAHKSQLNYDLYSIFADKTLFEDSSFGINDNARQYDLPLREIPVGTEKTDITIKGGVVKFDVTAVSDPEYDLTTLIKFGGFLCMLQKICQITDQKQSNLIQFEIVNNLINTPELDDSFLVTYPGNYSSDPNKCLIKYQDFNTNSFPPNTTNIPSIPEDTIINKTLHRTPTSTAEANAATPLLLYRLSDVYVNINFISTVLRNSTTSGEDDTQEVPILTLVNGILSGINECLGGINEFRTIYDEETATIKILSETPVSTVKEPSSEIIATLNTFGFERGIINEGSFITSLDLNSELSDQMATQITIGSQVNGNTSNASSTSFSSYSKGLIDNLMSIKKNPMDKEVGDEKIQETSAEKIAKIYNTTEILDSFEEVYDNGNFDESSYIGNLTSNNNSISQMMMGLLHQKNESPAPFFLPFNMSLEMHGLGGVRIYDAFKIDGKSLPLSYNPSDIKLMVTSLSHTVTLDGWKTKISTIPLPIFKGSESTYKAVGTAKSSGTFGSVSPATSNTTIRTSSNAQRILLKDDVGGTHSCEILMVNGFDTPPTYGGKAITPVRAYKSLHANKYVKDDIIKRLESSPYKTKYTKGVRMLALAKSIEEGYKPGSASYRTKNPGNIGNTDDGRTVSSTTLDAGIIRLINYFINRSTGNYKGFKFGNITIPQYYSIDIQKNPRNYQRPDGCLPGYTGNFQGQIGFFFKKYATFSRVNNNSINNIATIFALNGYPRKVDGNTLLKDLVSFNPGGPIKLS
jgi:hypothetical protein